VAVSEEEVLFSVFFLSLEMLAAVKLIGRATLVHKLTLCCVRKRGKKCAQIEFSYILLRIIIIYDLNIIIIILYLITN
jgi:hypothetical protein